MSISGTPENKNSVSGTNETKQDNSPTWDEFDIAWEDATGTWAQPGSPGAKENKNLISGTNESKN